MKELEKDMNMLRNGMKEVEREIEFFRTQPASNGDRYLLVMKEFSAKTGVRLSELEDLFIDMKARVRFQSASGIQIASFLKSNNCFY